MKIIFLIIIFIFINSNSFTAERSELEIKNKVFLEDIEEFGKFEQIDLAPNGMFENKYDQFVKMHQYSQKKLGLIFVKQKGLMDKYPENLMLGMGYFEFFYMAQLEENLKDIEKYQRDYPDVKNYTRKAVQKVYGLNKARKSMREALGFDLNDDVQDVLKTYFVLSKLFAKGEKITNTLSREEKKNYNSHKKLSENIGKIRSLVEEKSEQRIEEKKFNKEYKKLSKKIKDDLEKLSSLESYKVFRDFINELNEIQNPSIDDLLSSYKIANFLIGPIKEREIKKKYEVNLVNADFSDFSQDELKLLGESSKASKNNKVLKSNEIQKELFKIKNNNFIDVNSVIDKLKAESIMIMLIFWVMFLIWI
jgi:Tfp pilus assembly protein PilF